MRTILGQTPGLIVMCVMSLAWTGTSTTAKAQLYNPNSTTYYHTNTLSHGMYLPSVAIPHSNDEVRASDGTACRSSMASNKGYLDVGAIGNQDPARDTTSASVYGRVVMPLGEKPQRIDCSVLYNLEVERLRMELELARMGARDVRAYEPGATTFDGQDWHSEGWHNSRTSDQNWSQGTSVSPR